jgi:hypothetical protein
MQTCPSLIFILIQDAILILYLSRWFVRVGKILGVMVFYFEALLRLLLSFLPFYSSDRCFCISSLCLSCAPMAAPWESTLWLTNPSCVLNDAPQASHVNFLFSAIQLAIWLNIGYKIIQWWWRRIYTRALLQNIRAASSINWHFIYARSTTSDCYCRKGGPRGFQQKISPLPSHRSLHPIKEYWPGIPPHWWWWFLFFRLHLFFNSLLFSQESYFRSDIIAGPSGFG